MALNGLVPRTPWGLIMSIWLCRLVQFGVTLAYILVAYCYFGVAYTGYYAFGNAAGDQILYTLGHPVWVVCTASVMVIVHVCGSFQVCFAFAMLCSGHAWLSACPFSVCNTCWYNQVPWHLV